MFTTTQQHPADLTRIARPYLMILALTVLTLAVLGSVIHHDFVNYDDDRYIVKNHHLYNGLSWKGIRWALGADLTKPSEYVDYWQPVTLLSRMMDVQLFGLNARGHHTVSLALHLFNVILIFELLWSLTGALGRSAVVAAVFAIHPLMIEPMAWATARKDLLSLFFGLLTLKAYSEKSRLAPFLFSLSLLAKPMLVTLPLLLILWNYWPLNQFRKENMLGILPYGILSLIFGVVPFIGQPRALQILTHDIFLANIPLRYCTYLRKFFYPMDLAIYSPPVQLHLNIVASVLAALFILALSLFFILEIKKYPYLFVGWFWFLIALAPTWGSDRFEDRFMYVPITGLLITLVWGAWDFIWNLRWRKGLAGICALISFGTLTPLSLAQVSYWKNSFTLFEHSLQVNPHNFIAHNQLCAAWLDSHKPRKAASYCQKALELNPGAHQAHYNFALTMQAVGKTKETLEHYEEALRIKKDYFQAHSNLGVLLSKEGHLDEANRHLSEAVRIHPDSGEIRVNFANLLLKQGKKEEAILQYKEALRLKPNSPAMKKFVADLESAQKLSHGKN